LDATVHQALKTVPALKKGEGARESKKVAPVPELYIDAIKHFVSRWIWAMVALQRCAGMRPNEVCVMRTCDISMPSHYGSTGHSPTKPSIVVRHGLFCWDHGRRRFSSRGSDSNSRSFCFSPEKQKQSGTPRSADHESPQSSSLR
jgi:hypothetical protein